MRPLLVVDGDSFAHRAYHALPKSIRGAGGRPGALVGFTNMLVRLWEAEHPRQVLVAWDSIGVPTYRNEAFPAYQSGRVFDPELLEQLDALPDTRRTTFSRRRPGRRAARSSSRPPTATRSSSQATLSPSSSRPRA